MARERHLRCIALGQREAIAAGGQWISGPELRTMRTDAKLTQQQLAKLAGCSLAHIANCEAGRMRLSVALAEGIRAALGNRAAAFDGRAGRT